MFGWGCCFVVQLINRSMPALIPDTRVKVTATPIGLGPCGVYTLGDLCWRLFH